MSLIEKVEVGFDLVNPVGPFFTLDDPIKGQLDGAYKLAGLIFYDITSYVTAIQVNRGKSDNIANISAGEIVVELNNRSRAFDPEYLASPFFGQILPKRTMRFTTNGIQQAQMVIDDWNFDYTPDGDAKAYFTASDGFVYLNNQSLAGGTATAQLSGERINAVLDSPFVQWPPADRAIDTGTVTLGADVISDGQGVLSYLQKVEGSEQGLFFISKDGLAVFVDKANAPVTAGITVFSDGGSGVPYQNIQIEYGSENLLNEVNATSVITNNQISAISQESQDAFGIFSATFDDLLLSSDDQVTNFATTLLGRYSQPVYRFRELQVRLNDLSLVDQNKVLNLELGDFVQVIFTPSNIPPAVIKYASVIRISHSVDISGEHLVTLGLNTQNLTYLVLDDLIFGKLDEGSLA